MTITITDPLLIKRITSFCNITEPVNNLSLHYLAEGAANVIYTVQFKDAALGKHNNSIVLRLRKDLPFTIPSIQALSSFNTRIAPLFASVSSLLLRPLLCELTSEAIQALNQDLHDLEKTNTRPQNRHHIHLPPFSEEANALILPNLNHSLSSNGTTNRKEVIIEFKPKWLIQSPSAPSSFQRCRTCALNSMRRSISTQKGLSSLTITGRGDSGFCPFDLLSPDHHVLSEALTLLWSDSNTNSDFTVAFKDKVQPVLRYLKGLQERFNEVGLEDFETSHQSEGHGKGRGKEEGLEVAMALRDCSLFLRVGVLDDGGDEGMEKKVEITDIKILDLDLKNVGGGKIEKWARMERELIDGGWYMLVNGDDGMGVRCALSGS